MRMRPLVVAYEEVPTAISQMLPKVDMGEREPTRWCAVCASEHQIEDVLVKLKPLYRTGKLPGRCVKCGIDLKELAFPSLNASAKD